MNRVLPSDPTAESCDLHESCGIQNAGPVGRAFPAYAMLAGLEVAALLMVVRRLGGGLLLGLTAERVGISAAIAVGMSLLAREVVHRTNEGDESRAGRLCLGLAVSFPLVALGIAAASWRLALAAGITVATGLVAGVASYYWRSLRVTGPKRQLGSAVDSAKIPLAVPGFDSMADFDLSEDVPAEESENFDLESQVESSSVEDLDLQSGAPMMRMSRYVTADGADRLEGTTWAEFHPGQKVVAVHVAFCPPFIRSPTLVCSADSANARVGLTTVYPYGARVELKRSGSVADSLQVAVTFQATLESAQSAAA